MKKINNKGAVPVGLIILLVVAALAVVAVFAFKGFGFGGGNGDGEGSGIADNSNTVSVVEELEYINVTVSGNELIDSIKSLDKNLPVKIADEGSSLKAYKALKAKLSENSISFIEAQ